jgi:hypothetical protein
MRSFFALILSSVLAVTSVTAAIAHGQAPTGLDMTICIEGGTTTITLDANGNPVPGGNHLFLDCLGGVTAIDLPAPLALLSAPVSRAAALPLPPAHILNGIFARPGHARDPPPFV